MIAAFDASRCCRSDDDKRAHVDCCGIDFGKCRDLDIFVWAILFAVVIFVIGFIGSIVLKGVRTPGAGALTLALVLAIIIAALTLVPQVTRAAADAGLRIATLWWPLVGAMVGYFIKR